MFAKLDSQILEYLEYVTLFRPQSYRKMAELYTSLMFFTSLVLRCNDLQSRVLPQKTCFLLPYTIVKKSFWISILAYLWLLFWSGVWALGRLVCCKFTWLLRCNDLQSPCFLLPYTIELNLILIYIIFINSVKELVKCFPDDLVVAHPPCYSEVSCWNLAVGDIMTCSRECFQKIVCTTQSLT